MEYEIERIIEDCLCGDINPERKKILLKELLTLFERELYETLAGEDL